MAVEFRPRGRIVLAYHSGSGGTALAAKLVGEMLSSRHEIRLVSVEASAAASAVRDADFLALFFPTYFLRPSPSAMAFIGSLGPFRPPKPAYLVATFELYPENSIRAAALALKERGIAVLGSKALRSPGSDASCALPAGFIPWLYRFERRFPRKILEIAAEIDVLAPLRGTVLETRSSIPRPKWYTPLAQALQVLAFDRFGLMRGHFRVIAARCTRCGACVALCSRRAWSLSGGLPRHEAGRCELCTRCIHRCPRRAIVLVSALRDNPRLDSRLYAELEARARRRLAQISAPRG